MQDRYFGDIGDFAKYGLLRAVTAGKPPLSLAVLWYLVPDERHNKDGRHIDYLDPTEENPGLSASATRLYDKLGELVRTGVRRVSAVPEHNLLPPGTTYHDRRLDYSHVPRAERPRCVSWLTSALQAAEGADVVFLDPDNGLEVRQGPWDDLGPKYVFYDDLAWFSPAQTIVVYQHSARTAGVTFRMQLQDRMQELHRRLDRPREALFAMRWRRISARAFIFAAAAPHRATIRQRLALMLEGPWGKHFELVEAESIAGPAAPTARGAIVPPAAPAPPVKNDAVEVFHGGPDSAAEQGFAHWRRENPDGFYINVRSPGHMMLHAQSCSGLDFKGKVCLTLTKKVCSSDRQALEAWAARNATRPLRLCKRCLPGT